MITIEQLVQREVNCCLSSLVSTLAAGAGYVVGPRGLQRSQPAADLMALAEQAQELATSIPDYQEAAEQEGWAFVPFKGGWGYYAKDNVVGATAPDDDFIPSDTLEDAARECCEFQSIEPYEWDVFEHWSVSTWLAEQLEKHGEKVDTDFAGMNVWARTTTGQGIASDGVIARIYADMVTP
jgi:hypothetical protein